jgi:hypothetical protein
MSPFTRCVIWVPLTALMACAAPGAVQQGTGGYSIVSESVLDASNRYASTVRVTTTFNGKKGVVFKTCSGVVAHAQLILTAGHCVCPAHPGTTSEDAGTFVVDASQCAKTATVTTVRYKPLTEEQRSHLADDLQWPADVLPQTGRVRPHPEIKIRYASESDRQELSSNADLAVIILEQPLAGGLRAVPLANTRVRVAEPVISVGYGVTRLDATDGGARRLGTNEVASLEETSGKTFRIAKPLLIPPTFSQGEPLLMRETASYALDGDSGGPCLRENGDTFELVGIAKTSYRAPVEFSEYTSTYFYREWIRQQLALARKAASLKPAD